MGWLDAKHLPHRHEIPWITKTRASMTFATSSFGDIRKPKTVGVREAVSTIPDTLAGTISLRRGGGDDRLCRSGRPQMRKSCDGLRRYQQIKRVAGRTCPVPLRHSRRRRVSFLSSDEDVTDGFICSWMAWINRCCTGCDLAKSSRHSVCCGLAVDQSQSPMSFHRLFHPIHYMPQRATCIDA